MELQLLISLSFIHLIALASPGPDFALVVRLATQESRAAAVASALGIAVAILGHTLLSLTGVSLIIQSSALLFTLVQLAGASYLAWMGMGAIKAAWLHWKDPVSIETATQGRGITPYKGFMQGLYTNILNPKALVFFISLMSTLVPAEMSLAGKSAALVILWSLSLAWFALLAWLLSTQKLQKRVQQLAVYIDTICGVIFITLGVSILYQSINILFV